MNFLKRNLNTILVIAGVWIVLFSADGLMRRSLTTKDYACQFIEHQIEQGRCEPTDDINSLYEQNRTKGYIKSFSQLLLGLIVLTIGMTRIIVINHVKFSRDEYRNLLIQMLYWILFIYGIGILAKGSWSNMDACGIDWIYLFSVSASVGFYGGYYMNHLSSEIKSINRNFIKLLFIISFFGGLLSYFPISIISGINSGNFKPFLSIQFVLAIGFFCFISFIHVFIGFALARTLRRIK